MPIYEKRTDRDRQEEARAILSEYWKVDIYDVPRFYQCDWQLMRNERTYAFAEYKWRSYSSTQIDEWGGFKLKLSKYIHGAQLLEWTGVPWLFVADLTDGLFLYKMEEVVQPETIGRFGTTRRGDKNDLEPAIIIPMEEFEDISIKRNWWIKKNWSSLCWRGRSKVFVQWRANSEVTRHCSGESPYVGLDFWALSRVRTSKWS